MSRPILHSLLFLLGFTVATALTLRFANATYASSLPNGSAFPGEYEVPRISRTDAPERIRESKSCREYLSICERSCKDRGDMFKFACIGQDFQPFEDHSRCTCADDLFSRREVPRQEQIQVKQDQEPKQ